LKWNCRDRVIQCSSLFSIEGLEYGTSTGVAVCGPTLLTIR